MSSDTPERNTATALALVLAVAILLPTLGYGFGYDHGFLSYLAWGALHGRWPYTDSWDTAFPGAILLHMAVIAAGGKSVLAIRVADLVIQTINAFLLFLLGRRFAGPRAGVMAAALYSIAYVAGTYYHTAQRDGYMVPLLLAALWFMWRFFDEPADARRRGPLIASAVCAGLSCLFRPTYALVVALAAIAVVFVDARGRGRVAALVDAVCFGGVAAVPLLVFVAVYFVTGRGRAISELVALLGTVYQYLERKPRSLVLMGFWDRAPKALWYGTVLALLSGVWRKRPREFWTLMFLFAGCVVVRLWEAKNYRYQYWPALACLAAFAGVGWAWAAETLAHLARATGRRAAIAGAAVLALVLLAELGRTGLARYGTIWSNLDPSGPAAFDHWVADSHDQAQLMAYLAAHTQPSDEIQLWGPETVILYGTGRFSATRFIDPITFLCPSHGELTLFSDCAPAWHKPIQIAFRREMVDHLRAQPPRYIAAHYADGTLAEHDGYSIAPDLPELRELLDQRYVREVTFGAWSAFRLRDQ